MKVKVNGGKVSWSGVWETIILILFFLVLTAGAFGWGIIYENRRYRSVEKEVLLQDQKIKEINGKLIALEGRQPKEKK